MKTGLVIVAHPDDETIWMAGIILNFKNINWTIFSLCRKDDPDRAPKFKRVCDYYKAKGIISDLEDEDIMDLRQSLPEIEKRIKKELKRKRFDYIFTHGSNGEYGHIRHIGVHKAVKKLIQEKKLFCQHLFFFAYKLNSQKRIINYQDKYVDLIFNLTSEELKNKKNIIKEIYRFSKKSFEYKSCLEKETFSSL
ncbi:MAG: PIG-L family deacetylase [bacterium]|nr:PIG-L family deacetylase [bacterium]